MLGGAPSPQRAEVFIPRAGVESEKLRWRPGFFAEDLESEGQNRGPTEKAIASCSRARPRVDHGRRRTPNES